MVQGVRAYPAARWLIMGAAGRDFHNFHTMVRDHARGGNTKVVAFTATQIPGIEDRKYPRGLAGPQYPGGIPIRPEDELLNIIRAEHVTDVVFSYSDVSHQYVMELSARVQAAGAHFLLPGAEETMLHSNKPVVAVCAVRTGAGKSQTSRMIVEGLLRDGTRTVAVRHPMPYGDLEAQRVQRFATRRDMADQQCTIEEREEYEPYVERNMVVFAGVDYGDILRQAEAEASVILWDGGNNDTPFYKPDLHITVVDPLRPGHEVSFYPGLVNLTMAQVVVVNKANTANPDDISTVVGNIKRFNPGAEIIYTSSVVTAADPGRINGKRVLVVEDGPTVTHGGMPYGAGHVAALHSEARELVDPTGYLAGSLRETFEKYPHLKGSRTLPAMGYGAGQIADLAATINAVPCDAVVAGTPIDLARVLSESGHTINKPIVRAGYASEQFGGIPLTEIVARAMEKAAAAKANLTEV